MKLETVKRVELYLGALIMMQIGLSVTMWSQVSIFSRKTTTVLWRGRSVECVDGLISVRLSRQLPSRELDELVGKVSGRAVWGFGQRRVGIVEVGSGSLLPAIHAMKESSGYDIVEPTFITKTAAYQPSDRCFVDGHQWYLCNQGQTPPGGTSGADINMPAAWDLCRGSSDINVLVLDTGIPLDSIYQQLSHPDLNDGSRITLVGDYSGAGIRDNNGHGTHVAGLIGAAHNSTGISGVAPQCGLYIARVFDYLGLAYPVTVYNAVHEALNEPGYSFKVVNFSGGEEYESEFYEAAVAECDSEDVLFVAAAGNEGAAPPNGSTVWWPGRYSTDYSNVIAVSSTNPWDQVSTFSSTGPEVTVAGPGGTGGVGGDTDDVLSTLPNYAGYLRYGSAYKPHGDEYGYIWGTSMAAPIVAGLAALIRSIAPSLSAAQVRQVIENSATDLGSEGRDDSYGYGRIHAYNGLKYTIEHFSATLGGSGDTLVFPEDFTIATGTTLTVMPGTTVKFAPGASLIVNGTLVAEGTSSQGIVFCSNAESPSPGDWDGIVLNSGPNSLSYCIVQDAVDGIQVRNTSTNAIDHCTVQNCSYYGIFGYNTSKSFGALTIENSQIQDNLRGIALSNARADLLSVIVTGNQYQGLIGTSSSICYATYSQVTSNGYQGTYFSGSGSALTLGGVDYSPGYNTVYNNNYTESSNSSECAFTSSADGYLGFDDYEGGIWGYNNIYHGDNLGYDQKLVRNGSQPTIYAQFNYWGYPSGPPSSEFEGNVIYSEWLSGLQKVAPYMNPAMAMSHYSSRGALPMSTKIEHLLRRMEQLVAGDSTTSLAALGIIALIVGPGGQYGNQIAGGWNGYLLATAANTKNIALKEKAIAYWYDVVSASATPSSRASLADSLLGLSPGASLSAFCQEKKFFSAIDQSDFSKARFILEAMRDKKGDAETLTFFAEVLSLAEAEATAKQPSEHGEPAVSARGGNPDALGIDQNYPNPFNPMTRLTYRLNEPAKVHLVVYDVLGRVVAELVNGQKEAGDYTVSWDGSKLGSGVYFARIDVTTASGQTFTRTRKMALTK